MSERFGHFTTVEAQHKVTRKHVLATDCATCGHLLAFHRFNALAPLFDVDDPETTCERCYDCAFEDAAEDDVTA